MEKNTSVVCLVLLQYFCIWAWPKPRGEEYPGKEIKKDSNGEVLPASLSCPHSSFQQESGKAKGVLVLHNHICSAFPGSHSKTPTCPEDTNPEAGDISR